MCPTGCTGRRLIGEDSDLRSAFHVIDADRDGRISKDDLRKFYSGFSSSAAAAAAAEDDVIGAMMQVADSNMDGFVEYGEFEKVLEGSRRGRSERGSGSVMEEVFKVMDQDGDGMVGLDDLRVYLKWAGFEADDEDIKTMIRLGSVGGDEAHTQGVSFDVFLKILAF